MPTPETQQSPESLNIEISEEMAEGVFANLVMIAHSPEEFIMDFIRTMPGLPKARVKGRMILTPQHAKRLLHTLADNVRRYEAAYGEIREAQPAADAVPFSRGGQA